MSLIPPVLGPDPIFGRWLHVYEAYYQQPPISTPLPPAEGVPEGAASVHLPAFLERKEWHGTSGHFSHMPGMTAHLSRIGYAWNEDGVIVSAPTPATLNAMLGADAGFRVAYSEENTAEPARGKIVHALVEGTIVLPVGTESYYRQCLEGGRDDQRAKALPYQLGALVHGMNVHALNYHLIPRATIAALAEKVRGTFGAAVVASWAEPNKGAPPALATFYRGDLNRYAYAVYCRASTPEQFAAIFASPGNVQQLQAAFDARLAEATAALRGEPPPQVADVQFDIP